MGNPFKRFLDGSQIVEQIRDAVERALKLIPHGDAAVRESRGCVGNRLPRESGAREIADPILCTFQGALRSARV